MRPIRPSTKLTPKPKRKAQREVIATLTRTLVNQKTGKKTVGKPQRMSMTPISAKEFFKK